MARKSINELIAEANAAFPDNVTGLITPADLRDFVLNFLNAAFRQFSIENASREFQYTMS